jgi:hypothetical protein
MLSDVWTPLPGCTSDPRIAYQRLTGSLVRLPPRQTIRPSRKGKERQTEDDVLDLGATFNEEELKLLPQLVSLANVRGTMLCEEMGMSFET